MDKSYCQKIDRDLLVEKYVQGKMETKERLEFEKHLNECQVHAQAVNLEKALHRSISEIARSEIKSRLKRSIQKREDIRFYTLRYAAILFLVVITPLILYYQFYLPQRDQIQFEQIPPAPEAQESEIKSAEGQDIEDQKYDETKSDDVSREMKKIRLSDRIVSSAASQPKTEAEISRSAITHEKETGVAQDAAGRGKQEITRNMEEPSTPQQVKKVSAEKKSAGLGIASIPSEMSKITAVAEADSDIYREQENELRSCIEMHKNSIKTNPYLLTYSFIIDTSGHVADFRIQKMSESIAGIDSCFKHTIRKWQFDRSENEIAITRQLKIPIR